MRDGIIKKRVRADEVVSKAAGPSRELQKLQLANNVDAIRNENSEWNELDMNGGDHDYTCPSCLKKFDRKAVYTSHVQICSDIKDREQEKLKKRKAKDGAKSNNRNNTNSNSSILEADIENSMVSEQSEAQQVSENNSINKRKRQRTSKLKSNEAEISIAGGALALPENSVKQEENSEDVVDWNLDDEEENKKLDHIKKEIIEDEYKITHDDLNNLASGSGIIKIEMNVESGGNQDDLHDDDEDSGLIIDEKAFDESSQFNCPQCDKTFENDEKLKYHLTFYHSRQKRFKCKM